MFGRDLPLAAPGIPRSHCFACSRPFRCAKGAGLWLMGVLRWWWFRWFGWCALSRPGPSPQPSPVQRERGMFVADEGVTAVRVWCWFGWCAAPLRPGHTPLAALRSLAPLSLCERGVCGVGLAGTGVLVVWLVGPAAAPGIPRSHRYACSRPLTLREGGVGGVGWQGGSRTAHAGRNLCGWTGWTAGRRV